MKPEAYVGDMAYSPAELREGAAERGTEMVARVPPATGVAGCFSKDEFMIDLEAGSITCPAGEVIMPLPTVSPVVGPSTSTARSAQAVRDARPVRDAIRR